MFHCIVERAGDGSTGADEVDISAGKDQLQELRDAAESAHSRSGARGKIRHVFVACDLSSTAYGRARGSQDDAKMASARMTVATVAKELRSLAGRMDAGFARVDERFAQVAERFARVDERFDGLEARVDSLEARFDKLENNIEAKLEAFAERIEERFQVVIEGLRSDFQIVIDRTKATDERLSKHVRDNAEEHRLMQARVDELDSRIPPRRHPRRRPS